MGSVIAVERLHDSGHRSELGGEGLAVEVLEGVLPVGGEGTPQMRFDLGLHEGVGAADEALDDLALGEGPAQLGEDPHVDADGQALAVHEHAVAVEDDELERRASCRPGARR